MKIPMSAFKSNGNKGDTDGDKKQLKKKIKKGLLKMSKDPDNDGDVDFPNAKK